MKNTLKNDFLSSRVRYIPLEHIVPNPHQPRRDFDPAALSELADSIRQYGVLQPATVRTRGRDYELLRQLPRVLNAGVDVNRYRPVTLAELVENNRAFYAGERDDEVPPPPPMERGLPGSLPGKPDFRPIPRRKEDV